MKDNTTPKKFYCLDMFPYPSGSGLHVGHVEGYTASDIFTRYKKMNGFAVIHPMGWDSFGLPAENYAIKTGIHPAQTTDAAIATFKKQMNNLSLAYDWEREIKTSSPEYYKWTQYLFLFLYKNGLAYRKKAQVNWCEKCSTVLANEQAENGVCERCGGALIQKDLEQWFFKISDFIEDQEYQGRQIKGLINGLDDVDWPATTKTAQINWIGKSLGAQIDFKVNTKSKQEYNLRVFTTRPDTLYGCTFMVVSPEHEMIEKLRDSIENLEEVDNYIKQSKSKTEMERLSNNKDKSGVEIKGLTAINPINQKNIKIFVADYVLSTYGFGAIMAVPAHDERDYEFAKKYNLEIIEVISGGDISQTAYSGTGTIINSELINGLEIKEAQEKIIKFLEEQGIGQKSINYRLRDWLISRQRYWGAPIPIIYCDHCGEVPVPEKDLPVLLPDDVDFLPNGESPLKYSKSFHQVSCPQCGRAARRENDTMDTFVCSSWYYFRYLDPKNTEEFASQEKINTLMPVDLYIGGADHSVMHLLYARFMAKVLHKYGYTNINEPFKKLRHQGMILAEDSSKMSKSKGNVVNPDDVIAEYGSDTLRMYEMFMGPLEDPKPWNTKNILGVKRFLEKVEALSDNLSEAGEDNKELLIELNKSIKKVSEDIEDLKFNTAISQLMIMLNVFAKAEKNDKKHFSTFLILLAPFAPVLSEKLWQKLGHSESIFSEKWPNFDDSLIAEGKIKLAVQINGKTRSTIEINQAASEEEVIKLAQADKNAGKYLSNSYQKVIYVKNRIINFII